MLFGFFLLFFFRYISLFRFFFFLILPFSINFLHLFTCPVLLNCPPELNRSTERCPLNVPVYVSMAQRNMPLRMVMMSELMGIVRKSRSLCCAKILSDYRVLGCAVLWEIRLACVHLSFVNLLVFLLALLQHNTHARTNMFLTIQLIIG